jgi:creatinine amidohydrolase
MRGVFLDELTWPEAEARFRAGALVVVPIGAFAKEHGPHLPLGTDALVARELARRVAEALPVVVAPVVGFGYYPAFVHYPGSQHLRAETFVALLTDLFEGLVRQGVTRLAVINTGVSTEAPLRVAVRDFYTARGVRVATADIRGLGRATRGLLHQRLGGHADEEETSLVLAIAPGAVRLDRARPDYGHALGAPQTVFYQPTVFDGDPGSGPDHSATGARGDPTLATREKGQAILAEMARELVEGLAALYPDLGATRAGSRRAGGPRPVRGRGPGAYSDRIGTLNLLPLDLSRHLDEIRPRTKRHRSFDQLIAVGAVTTAYHENHIDRCRKLGNGQLVFNRRITNRFTDFQLLDARPQSRDYRTIFLRA